MRPAGKMRRWFHEAAVQTNAATDSAVFETIKTVYTRTVERKLARREPTIWRVLMKSPIIRLAAAAIVLIACGIGLSIWRTTGSGIVLAEVLTRLEQVKVFRCKAIVKRTGELPNGKPDRWEVHSNILQSKELGASVGTEEVDPNGVRISFGETRFDTVKKIFIHVRHQEKRYTRQELDDVAAQQMQKQLNRFSDPVGFFREITACKYVSLGRSMVDDVEVEGFHTTDPNCNREAGSGLKDLQIDAKVWIDVKTRLPVRYENLVSGLDNRGAKSSVQLTMYGFQWDTPVDVAEFDPPAIPDGYKIQDQFTDPANEETGIQGLKQSVELLGHYPERIDLAYLMSTVEGSKTSAALQLREDLRGLVGLDREQKSMAALKPMRLLNKFYSGLGSKDPAYYGKTVTPKDADKVLLRWKLSDSEYRVVFGDLHAQTVSPEKLAELEKAPPK